MSPSCSTASPTLSASQLYQHHNVRIQLSPAQQLSRPPSSANASVSASNSLPSRSQSASGRFSNSIYTIALYPYLKMHICMYAGWRCGCRSPQVQQCPQLSVRCPSATVFSLKSSSAISSLDQLHQRHGIHIKLSPVEQPPSALSTSQLLCYSLASCTSAIVSTSTPPARPTSCASGTCYLSPSSHRQLSPS